MSAEITYKYIGNDSFSVVVKAYRDCNGIQMANSPLKISSACGTMTVALTRTALKDVTNIPPSCGVSSRCSGTFQYGIEEHTFRGKFKLPSNSCCEFTLSWEQSARNSVITTGAADKNYYVETKLDRCLAPHNSSPSFVDIPTFLVGVNRNHSISNVAYDTIDGDVLTYELIEPLSAPATPIKYIGSFSPYKPLTFFGFPNAWLNYPGGFHFDSLTSNMQFRPTVANEVTVMAMRVHEWRKINGNYKKIGEVIRDVQVLVTNEPVNEAPVFLRHNPLLGVCSQAKTLCFDIPIVDSSANDTVFLKYVSNIKGVTFTNVGTKPAEPIVEVCINVDSTFLNSLTSQRVTIFAMDNNCPLPVKVEKTYYFAIQPQLPDSFGLKASLPKCREVEGRLINNTQFKALDTKWTIWNANDTFMQRGDTVAKAEFQTTGWAYVQLEVTSPTHCDKKVYIDSVFIDSSRYLKIGLGSDRLSCFKPSDTLSVSDTFVRGVPPYRYQWSTGANDTNSTAIFSLHTGTRKVWGEVWDANNCYSSDTILIGNYIPTVSLVASDKSCGGQEYTARAVVSAVKPQYSWVGHSTNNLVLTDVPTSSKAYTFSVVDSFGCKVDTTIQVAVYSPQLKINGKNKYCEVDTIVLKATKTGGLQPTQVSWQGIAGVKDSITLLPLHTTGTKTIQATITDSYGCKATDSITYTVNTRPAVILAPINTLCENGSPLSLSPFATPSGGKWFGLPVTSDTLFNPPLATIGSNSILYVYQDGNTGCYGIDSLTVNVVEQPKAEFIALKTSVSPSDTIVFINQTKNNSLLNNRWDFGDAGKPNNIQTSNNAQFAYSDTGRYTVKLWVSNSICSPDSNVKMSYIKVGGKYLSVNATNETDIKLYPNPAKDKLTVEIEEDIASITLIDELGRKVKLNTQNIQITNSRAEVNVQQLAGGFYTIEVEGKGGRSYYSKILITK